ncbi:MAG TPA: imidazole glycerol phosphate synthase subunit HisH, partial [Campylobacterales bacterium]|nr:imidazole glycerol phosphate synthase subunit HisH [Campylobacterales bacterium]
MKIAILNYNMGNLASVFNALKIVGENRISIQIENDPEKIFSYDKIVLPGVGAFGDAIEHLKDIGMDRAIVEFAKSGKYLLGVCLGMQLLFEKSEEFGEHKGLSLLNGEVKRFPKSDLKIPHMGWNRVFPKHTNSLFRDLDNPYLYFVHSYYVETTEENILATTQYGITFTSAIEKENIFGLQPHPEKSHNSGLKILKNF